MNAIITANGANISHLVDRNEITQILQLNLQHVQTVKYIQQMYRMGETITTATTFVNALIKIAFIVIAFDVTAHIIALII